MGRRLLPHTADLRLEAWSSTREGCLAEAVAALVESFADTTSAAPTCTIEFTCEDGTDAVVTLLDEVIYRMDTTGQLPTSTEVETAAGELRVRCRVTDVESVDLTGAVPKAVSLHELRFGRSTEGWSCAVTVDV